MACFAHFCGVCLPVILLLTGYTTQFGAAVNGDYQAVVEAIDRHVNSAETRLDRVKRLSEAIKSRRSRSDGRSFHPLDLYLRIKSLVQLSELLSSSVPVEKPSELPTENELLETSTGLFRLQETYHLHPMTIATNRLDYYVNNESYADRLVFSDSEIKEFCETACNLSRSDNYHCIIWLMYATSRFLNKSSPASDVNPTLLIERLSIALHKIGEETRARSIDSYLESMQTSDNEQMRFDLTEIDRILAGFTPKRSYDRLFPDQGTYERLCRGKAKSNSAQEFRLKCFYKRNHPYLKLAPLKIELLLKEPRIYLVKNAISDEESALLQRLASNKFQKSVISTTSDRIVAQYRTSKTAWLGDDEHNTVYSISKRIELMTDLTTETAEKMQIAQYGTAGHYMPHFDYAGDDRNHQFAQLGTGDRIATALFYACLNWLSSTTFNSNLLMNNGVLEIDQPISGGNTVFPVLELSVPPIKNDALIWHNLLKNGRGDRRTRHAACPVLLGTKIIANKWLHESGQEFRRLCAKDKNQ